MLISFLALLYYKKKYSFTLGIILAIIIWFLFLKSGVHPTIAGVLLAFTIPIKRRLNRKSFSTQLSAIANKIVTVSDDEKHLLTNSELKNIGDLKDLTFEVSSPLQHLEHKLHGLIAYFVLPVFAFANAGVVIGLDHDFDFSLMANIAISLFIGKFVGVALFSYLGIKAKITELPRGVRFKQILGISAIAGVGFTMSIFIDNLAFYGDIVSIDSAKVGIIIGSLISGIVGYLIIRLPSK
jgi:NhaA family Na+:H+ antiporter